jgi:hypothetical protein
VRDPAGIPTGELDLIGVRVLAVDRANRAPRRSMAFRPAMSIGE